MFRLFMQAAVFLALLTGAGSAEMVAFQSRLSGHYVGTDSAGLLMAQAQRPRALVLDMVRLNGNRVAFRDPATGMFLRAGVGQQTYLSIASPHIRGWETFEMAQDGPDVSLRSVQNGLFVGTDGSDARLAAVWGGRGRGQVFRLVHIGRPSAPVEEASHAPRSNLQFAGSWQLRALFENGRAISMSDRAMRQATFRIGRRGSIEGTTGCNSFSARIMDWRSAYRVEDFLMTRMRCQGSRGDVDRLVPAMLTDAAHFARTGTTLEIRDGNGRLRARLDRQ